MTTRPPRMLIDLGLASGDGGGIEAAAMLAQLLALELRGVFVEDEALLALSAHPFARELRLPAHAWSPLETQEVAAGLDATAARLRRLLEAQGARLGIPAAFEVLRGDAGACIAGLCCGADILALGTPESAAGRSFGTFPRAWRAALGSPASVLLLPSRLARRRGPVALVASDGEAEAVALRLAAATGEGLLILEAPGMPGEAAAERARRAALRVTLRRIGAGDAGAIAEGLGAARESLVVIARGSAGEGEAPPRLAAQRRVPVLLR